MKFAVDLPGGPQEVFLGQLLFSWEPEVKLAHGVLPRVECGREASGDGVHACICEHSSSVCKRWDT